MSGRDLRDLLLLIPCCKSKHGDGRARAVQSAPGQPDFPAHAGALLEEGRRLVVEECPKRFCLESPLRPAMVLYTGIMYETPGFRDALGAAFKKQGLHCLIVSAGYGLLRPDDPIHCYNVKMSDKGIKKIWKGRLPEVLADYVSLNGITRVFAALFSNYYEAVAGAQGRLSGVEFRQYKPCNPGRGQRRALEALGCAVIDLVRSDFNPDERWKIAPSKNPAAPASPPTSVKGKDAASSSPVLTEAKRAPGRTPRKPDFEAALAELFTQAERAGQPYVDIQAGQLHRQVAEYSGPNNRMPVCCDVMHKAMRSGDKVLPGGPKKGRGPRLTIRYLLPRKVGTGADGQPAE